MKHPEKKFLICNRGRIQVLAVTAISMMGSLLFSSSSLCQTGSYVSESDNGSSFPLSAKQQSVPLCLSSTDYPGVRIVAGHLQADIERVTGRIPEITLDDLPGSGHIVLIGTLGKNPLIDRLVTTNKLDVSEISGKWESFLVETVEDPFEGIDAALVIAGSDKRGTIYGMFDLSAQMGVSPWYWWADVPVPHKDNLYVLPGRYTDGQPAVKYRGIFINDEAPALSGWVYENYGGFNHEFYEHVFELILRLKGNFLWPAMWGRAFYDDDTLNPVLADRYGIVIGTSHHEPLMRAHDEWRRYGSGPWNYEKNEETLREFWREGIERMGSNESLVTVGMRGDGDEPMTEGTAIDLLERIVKDQREIIGQVTGKPASGVPQVWALYKEVQDYYDHGMRVPDDVTLLLCDDNWGNIRRLPARDEQDRAGGYGIYYHFDYVGGPRNYKWLNTNQIERVWEQMHLAWKGGVDRIWIVNVGDIKPMELPIQFFLDYAWDPNKITADQLPAYYVSWAEQQFGKEMAPSIGHILSLYTKYNSRRKPELLSPDTYSLTSYGEADRIVAEYNALVEEAEKINEQLPEKYRDAFYELVLFPVKACANLNELYVTVGKNRLYSRQQRIMTNDLAERARKLYAMDSILTYHYHHEIAGGKWNHMMSQTHIGYTYWQQPEHQVMPRVAIIDNDPGSAMGVAIEGSGKSWPGEEDMAKTVVFDPLNDQSFYIEVFNRGMAPFDYRIEPGAKWIRLSAPSGRITDEKRIRISVDWELAPEGNHSVPITVSGPDNSSVTVLANIDNEQGPSASGSIENNGYISIEAENFQRAVHNDSTSWLTIPNLGRTNSAITLMPVIRETLLPGDESPHLEYRVYLKTTGTAKIHVYLSPTLNYFNTEGLKFGISLDDGPVKTVNMHEHSDLRTWEQWVGNNINIQTVEYEIPDRGNHVLKYWPVDPGVILQKIVIETGPTGRSYLGPPESLRIN